MDSFEEFDHILLDLKRAHARKDSVAVNKLYVQLRNTYNKVASDKGSIDAKRKMHASLLDAKQFLVLEERKKQEGWLVLSIPIIVLILSELLLSTSPLWMLWVVRVMCILFILFVAVVKLFFSEKVTLEVKVRREAGWLDREMRGIEKKLKVIDKDLAVILIILFATSLVLTQLPNVLPGLAVGPLVDMPRVVSASPADGGTLSQLVLSCSFTSTKAISRIVIHEDSYGIERAREQVFSKPTRDASIKVSLPGVNEVNWWCEAWDTSGAHISIPPRVAYRSSRLEIISPSPPPVEYSGVVPVDIKTDASTCSVVVDGSRASLSGWEGCRGMISLPSGMHEITVFAVFDDGIVEDSLTVKVR